MLTRRDAILATSALCLTAARPNLDPDLAAIRATLKGGRLGVAALDMASGRRLALDADGRYAYCSVFKWLLAAAILAEVDAGRSSLDRPVHLPQTNLPDHSPVVRAHLSEGTLSIGALCDAAITQSDNAAANLLLPLIGGPAGLTRFVRRQGDVVTRFDRVEPTLNTNLPRDPRDTTTPAAMLGLMRLLLTGEVLKPGARARLIEWLATSATGTHRLRAGFPAGWRAGDKTGTGERGAANDVAIAWPAPGRLPLLVACFVDAPVVDAAAREAAMAAVGRLVASRLIA